MTSLRDAGGANWDILPITWRLGLFSQTAEYALRAVAYLCTHRQKMCGSKEIAEGTRVPAGYLSKIMKDLVDRGIVKSQRGPRGGFLLARAAEQISVLDVINAVDPVRRITHCPLGIPEHGTKLCRLHRKLDDAIAVVEETLRAAVMTDLVEPSQSGTKALFPISQALTVSASKTGRK